MDVFEHDRAPLAAADESPIVAASSSTWSAAPTLGSACGNATPSSRITRRHIENRAVARSSAAPRSARSPAARRSATTRLTSEVLPIPASPVTMIRRPAEDRRPARAAWPVRGRGRPSVRHGRRWLRRPRPILAHRCACAATVNVAAGSRSTAGSSTRSARRRPRRVERPVRADDLALESIGIPEDTDRNGPKAVTAPFDAPAATSRSRTVEKRGFVDAQRKRGRSGRGAPSRRRSRRRPRVVTRHLEHEQGGRVRPRTRRMQVRRVGPSSARSRAAARGALRRRSGTGAGRW